MDIILQDQNASWKIDQIMKPEPKEEKPVQKEIYQIRQEKALPLIDALFTWTRELETSIPPRANLERQGKYGSNEEQYLRNYLLDGHLEITTAIAEREGIKPAADPAQEWTVLIDTQRSKVQCNLTLIASAKLNGAESRDISNMCWTSFQQKD